MSAFNQFIELFQEVWVQGVFGINVSEIIIGLTIFLFFYVLRRLFARFLINKLTKLVLKSDNQLDDTIINVIEGPLKFLPVVIGFSIATSYIEFSSEIKNFIDGCLELVKLGGYLYIGKLFNNYEKGDELLNDIGDYTIEELLVYDDIDDDIDDIFTKYLIIKKCSCFKIFKIY